MPELPEVETVKNGLKKRLVDVRITGVNIYYDKLIKNINADDFRKRLTNQIIKDIKRQGKWLIFELENDILLSHLRMEGKYFFKGHEDGLNKHEHIVFDLDNGQELRYQDTRKFGAFYLYSKEDAYNQPPLSLLGPEPFDVTSDYLKKAFHKKNLPIKTVLLDQTIITGIGNIYDNEILFLSGINPLTICSSLTDEQIKLIIKYSREVLIKAIENGGTTIHSYTAVDGISGKFQQQLLIHGHKGLCAKCQNPIKKIKVGGRGTYYCPNCQR